MGKIKTTANEKEKQMVDILFVRNGMAASCLKMQQMAMVIIVCSNYVKTFKIIFFSQFSHNNLKTTYIDSIMIALKVKCTKFRRFGKVAINFDFTASPIPPPSFDLFQFSNNSLKKYLNKLYCW